MTYFDDIRAMLGVKGLSPAAKLVFIYLYDRQGGNGHSWPSIATIEKDCCITRPTVVRAIKNLNENGYLTIERPENPSIGHSNRYAVTSKILKPVKKFNQLKNDTGTGKNLLPEPVKKFNPNESLTKSINEQKIIFDNSRKIYPGRKRGLSVEFDAFKKAVKDWRDIIPILEPSIRAYAAHCEQLKATGQFCPNHKDFCRWLKNRCWETEYPDPMAGATREATETEIDKLLGTDDDE